MRLMWPNSCEGKTSDDTENRPWKSEKRDGADRAACETGSSGRGADGRALGLPEADGFEGASSLCGGRSCRADAAAAEDLFRPSVISLNCLRWELISSWPSANAAPLVLLNVLLLGSFLLSLRKQLR